MTGSIATKEAGHHPPSVLDSLLTPFRCKSLSVPNRFMMAPMSRYFAPGGMIGEDNVEYYRRRIEGGAGAVITEGMSVDRPGAVAADNVPQFHGRESLAMWRRVVDACHAAGGAFIPQLWHVGGCTDFNYPDSPHPPLESPSGWVGPEMEGGRPMSESDVADVIQSFVRGALDAKSIGCDAIELHGAHGYLFDQFFWAATNRRSDRYGGAEIGARSRFAAEVVATIREAVGPDFALIFRMSQWKVYEYECKLARNPAELEEWLAPIAEAGVDIFHCSDRRFWEPAFEGDDRNLAGWTKKLVGKPTITVGSVGLNRDLMQDFVDGESLPEPQRLDELVRRYERGDFDLVAIGRVLIANHDWIKKVLQRRFGELKPYSLATKDELL